VIALVLGLAFGQVAVSSTPDEEIVVYGELAKAKARDALVKEMERLGWRAIDKGGGHYVFRGPSAWMGKATFDPEMGNLDFRRPAVGFRLANYDDPGTRATTTRYDADGQPVDAVQTSGAGFWVLPSKRKVDAVWSDVRQATRDELDRYQEVTLGTAFEARLAVIPERLDRLWSQGVPLDGGPALETGEPRVRAVLEFWATRLDSPDGRRMMKAVEAWIDANLVDQGHLTEALRVEYEARRDDNRTLPAG
jgi:hypothetical protein